MNGQVRAVAVKHSSVRVHTHTHTQHLYIILKKTKYFFNTLKQQELVADFWKQTIVSSNLISASFEPCDLLLLEDL